MFQEIAFIRNYWQRAIAYEAAQVDEAENSRKCLLHNYQEMRGINLWECVQQNLMKFE